MGDHRDRGGRAGTRTGRALALGLGAGLMSGLFGVGGGVVLVPGLVLLLGLAQHAAHATSLAAIILTACAALVGFAIDGSVAWLPGAGIAVGAVGGAFAGATVMHRLSDRRLRQAFALLLLVVAVRMLVGIEVTGGGGGQDVDALRLLGFVGLGLGAGTLSALMGVGGGVILVPGMVLLFAFSQHTAEGTSLLVIVPTAVMGAARHARRGYTDWRLGALVGAGGVVGGLVGAQLALALAQVQLQRLFALLLVVVGARMLLRPGASEPT